MSIALVTTRGFSNGTLVGSISDLVTRGYTIGAPIISPDCIFPISGGTITEIQAFDSGTINDDPIALQGNITDVLAIDDGTIADTVQALQGVITDILALDGGTIDDTPQALTGIITDILALDGGTICEDQT